MNRLWVLGCICLAAAAQADTACRVVTAGSLAFGNYDVITSTPNDSSLNVTVACDRNGGAATVTVEIGLGPGSSGTSVDSRRMAQIGGTDYLSYGLFRDSGRGSVWGTTSGIDTMSQRLSVPNHGTASAVFTVYARIPAQQNVSVGTYSDSVRLTLTP